MTDKFTYVDALSSKHAVLQDMKHWNHSAKKGIKHIKAGLNQLQQARALVKHQINATRAQLETRLRELEHEAEERLTTLAGQEEAVLNRFLKKLIKYRSRIVINESTLKESLIGLKMKPAIDEAKRQNTSVRHTLLAIQQHDMATHVQFTLCPELLSILDSVESFGKLCLKNHHGKNVKQKQALDTSPASDKEHGACVTGTTSEETPHANIDCIPDDHTSTSTNTAKISKSKCNPINVISTDIDMQILSNISNKYELSLKPLLDTVKQQLTVKGYSAHTKKASKSTRHRSSNSGHRVLQDRNDTNCVEFVVQGSTKPAANNTRDQSNSNSRSTCSDPVKHGTIDTDQKAINDGHDLASFREMGTRTTNTTQTVSASNNANVHLRYQASKATYIEQFSTRIHSDQSDPCRLSGIVVLDNGQVVVTDINHQLIMLYGSNHQYLDTLECPSPCGITMVTQDTIAVTLFHNRTVMEVKVHTCRLERSRVFYINCPDVLFDVVHCAGFYYVLCRAGEVHVLDAADGSQTTMINTRGQGCEARHLEVGSDGMIYLSGSDRLVCFNNKEQMVWQYPRGPDQRRFTPGGLVLYNGRLFVADWCTHKVREISKDGVHTRDVIIDHVQYPQCLAVQQTTGRMFVTQNCGVFKQDDTSHSRSILVFKSNDKLK